MVGNVLFNDTLNTFYLWLCGISISCVCFVLFCFLFCVCCCFFCFVCCLLFYVWFFFGFFLFFWLFLCLLLVFCLVFCFVCCLLFYCLLFFVFLFYKGWVQSASSPHLPLPVKPTVIILACSPIAIFFPVSLRAYLKHFLCYPGLLRNRCWDARFFYVVSESCAVSRPNANRMHVFARCSHRKIIVLALLYKNAAVFHSV